MLKNWIINQDANKIQAAKDMVFNKIFLRRIEIPNVARIKISANPMIKMNEAPYTCLVDCNGAGINAEEVSELILPVMDCSTFFVFSKDSVKEVSMEFQVIIANQTAPAIKIIPKMERIFFVKNVSIF